MAFHEVDESKIGAQDIDWINDLLLMIEAQAPSTSSATSGVVLPEGVRITPA